ncbi:TRAP transporter small permease (plasmid) [Tistrella mobilis]|uniref:TRAP transporter small permease n=1 Tax=Tistrella mobilis TaxID=171437 RepID=UPI003558FA9E
MDAQVSAAVRPVPWLDLAEKGLGAIGVAALAFSVLYVGIAVAGTLVGLVPPDEDLLVAEAMVVLAFLPQWLLVRRRRHVAVEALTRALPAGVQRALDVFAALCGIAAYGILGWAAWIAFDRAWLSGSLYIGELELMAWPGRLLVVIGLAGGLAACLLELLRAVTAGAAREGQAREGGTGR